MKKVSRAFLDNKRLAESHWGKLSRSLVASLKYLTSDYGLSVQKGDVVSIDGHWYVTHPGLLRLAFRRHCTGIRVEVVRDFSEPGNAQWAFKATVFRPGIAEGFVGFGDANPSNVSSLVRGAEMRVAETRAVNRALRKAYGIGICSAEEMGATSKAPRNPIEKLPPQKVNGNGSGSGPKVRDRLCQIIRQHKLDPELVKAYAVDFCGTKTLREASREQVENFVQQLADWADKDRSALICQLNSYPHPKQEVVA